MNHRPYPNRDRALRQLARHTAPEPPTVPALAQLGEAIDRARTSARKILEDRQAAAERKGTARITIVENPRDAINRARSEGFDAGFRAGYTGEGHPHARRA